MFPGSNLNSRIAKQSAKHFGALSALFHTVEFNLND